MHPALQVFLAKFEQLNEAERNELGHLLEVEEYPAHTQLLRCGEVARQCYFVLEGLVREYRLIDGTEKTTAFYTEGQAVVSFVSYTQQIPADHDWVCAETCVLLVGDFAEEQAMYQRYPKLRVIVQAMMAQDLGQAQQSLSRFKTATPTERYQQLQAGRPELLHRVPQHQLASYLGVTPESLSRIRRRLAQRAEN